MGIIVVLSSFNKVKNDKISRVDYERTVYICKGPMSKKYHFNSNCRGLKRCSTKISSIDIAKAKKMGRTLCGWED